MNTKTETNQEETIDQSKFSRFDLEQYILHCWAVTDDLRTVGEQFPEARELASSLSVVYEMRFNRLWDLFEKMISSKQIR